MIDFKHIWNNVHGISNADEEEQLQKWLLEDEKNSVLYNKIKDFYLGNADNAENSQQHLEEQWLELNQSLFKKKRLNRRIVAAAAVAATIALFFIGISRFTSEDVQNNSVYSDVEWTRKNVQDVMLYSENGTKYNLTENIPFSIDEPEVHIEISKNEIRYYRKDKESPDKTSGYHSLHIPDNQAYKVQLSDGSTIWINENSALRFPAVFNQDSRNVELIGEGYFEVEKDDNKPFRVKTNNQITSVLGTAFNISSFEDDPVIYTTLVEGKVKVYLENNPGISEILSPEEQVLLSKENNSFTKRKVQTRAYVAWKDGYFYFHDQSLESIMNTLAEWYNIEIEFANKDLKKIRFSGELKKYDEFEKVLQLIEKTNELTYQIDGKNVTLK